MNHATLGSRVYYRDNGPEDTGTIIDIVLDFRPFVVKWDKPDLDHHIVGFTAPDESGVSHFAYGEADELIDQYLGNQLALIDSSYVESEEGGDTHEDVS